MKKFLNRKLFILIYALLIFLSFITNYKPGITVGVNFYTFAISMLKILPCAFILIGLFEVWVKREAIEKHFGESSGFKGYLWAILLSSTTVGGAYVAFPIAHSLLNKGAKLSVVLTYVGAAAIARIPMTIFESTYLGLKFSIIRLAVSLPLVVLSSMFIDRYFHKDFTTKEL
ncbi:permease [Clostridium sp. 'deep sea']|uniref:permease n=1 Tax=Clostridium sp. 'deep sea' TaxID=2779445 RepID=UPI0018969112|nr:permease [Clostridium sp. 'deep sea']QOR34183.1 permease [Clostridium sp. 'deep sea']